MKKSNNKNKKDKLKNLEQEYYLMLKSMEMGRIVDHDKMFFLENEIKNLKK